MTPEGVGPIHIGMTVAEARKAFPQATFIRIPEADFAPAIGVELGRESLMEFWVWEEEGNDPDPPIDEQKEIYTIVTSNPLCHTEEGIHSGSLVLDAEKILGKAKETTGEGGPYVSFEKQPKHMGFGMYDPGGYPASSPTTKFSAASTIWSISVTSVH